MSASLCYVCVYALCCETVVIWIFVRLPISLLDQMAEMSTAYICRCVLVLIVLLTCHYHFVEIQKKMATLEC